jgi:hypothetical protein
MSDQDSSTIQQKIETLNSEVFDINHIPTSKEAAEENKAKGLDTTNLKQWALQQHTQAVAKVKLEKIKVKPDRPHLLEIITVVISITVLLFIFC